MFVCVLSHVRLCNPMDCSPPGSSVHGILQARKPVLLLFSHSVMSDSLWPHALQRARLPCPSLSPPELAQIHVHWVGDAMNHFILLSSSPSAFSLSQHQGFSNELALCIRWPKYTMFFSYYYIFIHIFLNLGSQKTDVFEQWCCRRLLRLTSIAKRSNQSILKEINPEYALEGLMLKLKIQYFGMDSWLFDI